jgi:hypothetical protein
MMKKGMLEDVAGMLRGRWGRWGDDERDDGRVRPGSVRRPSTTEDNTLLCKERMSK